LLSLGAQDLHSLFVCYTAFTGRSFASLTQLRFLTLALEVTVTGETFDFAQFILHVLRHLTSPCLQEVNILHLYAPRYYELATWSELRLVLESPRFLSTLLRLAFYVRLAVPGVVADAQRIFAGIFPLCEERGILHVEKDVLY
jgi:hypothetical protein